MTTLLRALALDGPAGSGKSTIARLLAARLGWTYLETGAIYRALALECRDRGVDVDDPAGAAACARALSLSFQRDEAGANRVLLAGQDVSDRLYAPDVSAAASRVSAHPAVRAALVDVQRAAALAADGVVLEGRDIGTVILPEAPLKVFVTASAEERARRRQLQLAEQGREVPFDEVLDEVNARDRRDTEREAAPLKQADDALLLDTTGVPLDEVIERLVQMARERGL